MPQILAVILGAVGAALVARLVSREWRRVNDELERMRAGGPAQSEPEAVPVLRRDPVTGVYRPQR